jgi:dethiobiotin synthetase
VRLGCLNHAVLTFEAIRRDGAPFVGWVANGIESGMPRFDANVVTLARLLGSEPLAVFPYAADGNALVWSAPVPSQK